MLLDEVALDLEAAGLGTRGTDLFETRMPEQPDACVAVFDEAGSPPLLALGASDVDVERPRLVVWARALTDGAARTKIRQVWERYRGKGEAALTNAVGGTTRYLSITAVHSPFLLKRDQAASGGGERVTYACNFEVLKEVSTG